MEVVVWSDYQCPWCYLALPVADRLAARGLEVRWRPYHLHPEVPPEGMAMRRRYPGLDSERGRAHVDRLRRLAADAGLPFAFPDRMVQTLPALAASEAVAAEEPEAHPSFHRALFGAYWAEGRDLGDEGVLAAVATETGVDPDRAVAAAADPRWRERVAASTGEAVDAGATGTPAWWFARSFLVTGLQPAGTLERIAARLRPT